MNQVCVLCGKEQRNRTCSKCLSRESRSKASRVVRIRFGQDERGRNTQGFRDDGEARKYIAWIKALGWPEKLSISPAMTKVISQWLEDGTPAVFEDPGPRAEVEK